MSEQDKIQLFEDQPIRTAWDAEQEEWFFSIVDVVGVLTGQPTQRNASIYWTLIPKIFAGLCKGARCEIDSICCMTLSSISVLF